MPVSRLKVEPQNITIDLSASVGLVELAKRRAVDGDLFEHV
jgi:hypothetical protein